MGSGGFLVMWGLSETRRELAYGSYEGGVCI